MANVSMKKKKQNDHETQHQVQQQQQSLQKRLQQCGHLLLTTKRTFVWNSFSRTRRMQSATALAKQQQQCEQTIYTALQHAELLWRCRGMMCDDHNVVDSATTAITTSAACRWPVGTKPPTCRLAIKINQSAIEHTIIYFSGECKQQCGVEVSMNG